MSDLRQFFEAGPCSDVKTLLQSGNVVGQTKSKLGPSHEKILEEKAAKRWHRPIDFLLRDDRDWEEILAGNPYTEEALGDPGHLHVMFLKAPPGAEALASLKDAIRGREYFQARGRELYIVYPDGSGNSKFTLALIEKKLGTRGTARNWNTVQKVAALLRAE